jgi:hypothetical protein
MSQDIAAPVKVIQDYIKEFEKLTIKVGFLGTRLVSAENIDDLLKMPTKDELIPKILGQLQAPILSFLGTLQQSNPILPLVNVLNQISPMEPLVGVLNQISPMAPLTTTLQNIVNNFTHVLQAIATQKEKASEG